MPRGFKVSTAAFSRSATCFQPSTLFVRGGGLAMTMYRLPMIRFSSIAFFSPSPVKDWGPLCVE